MLVQKTNKFAQILGMSLFPFPLKHTNRLNSIICVYYGRKSLHICRTMSPPRQTK